MHGSEFMDRIDLFKDFDLNDVSFHEIYKGRVQPSVSY